MIKVFHFTDNSLITKINISQNILHINSYKVQNCECHLINVLNINILSLLNKISL